MTFKKLYFGLLGLLIGLLGSVYFASKEVSPQSFGSLTIEEQVVVTSSVGELNNNDYRLSYSPNIHRRLTMPPILGVIIVVAWVVGFIAGNRESKNEAIGGIQMRRSLQNFLLQAVILVLAFSLILIIYLPWYYGVIAILGVMGVAWLVIRLMKLQWQKDEEIENERSKREANQVESGR